MTKSQLQTQIFTKIVDRLNTLIVAEPADWDVSHWNQAVNLCIFEIQMLAIDERTKDTE